MGVDQLPGLERHHAACFRLAGAAHRTQAAADDFDFVVHSGIDALRHVTEYADADFCADSAGRWRRRHAAVGASDPARELCAGAARQGDGSLWGGHCCGAGDRSHAGRVYYRQLLVALDFLHQSSCGLAGAVHGEPVHLGSTVSSADSPRGYRTAWRTRSRATDQASKR